MKEIVARMTCISVEELERLNTGSLDHEATAEIEAHLSHCPDCRRRLSEVSENLAFIERLRSGLSAGTGDPEPIGPAEPPERIGSYDIVCEIGRGGMGIVYEARQQDPPRSVALKVLNVVRARDPDSARLFRREVRALARVSHSGIAAVYEAGTTDDGQSYFAMELVDGLPLVRFAREHDLSIEQRLKLYCRVGRAIEFAHQRGVIHRDLKPSNILVTADCTPMVLDFGLAKLMLEPDGSSEVSIRTEIGRVFGTLPYMSPEQARGDATAIDVRSDVYSLGVVLYELLTGALPYDVDARHLPAAVRTICEQAPRRPSAISPAIRGDLEAVVLRAIEKSPERRYQNAGALVDDLEHVLRHEPVSARPPSTLYQLRMLARRNRPLVATVAMLALALLIGVAASTWQAVRATSAEAEAKANLDRATHETERFRAVNSFLLDMLASANPEQGANGRDVTVHEKLQTAAALLDGGQLDDQPDVELAVRLTLGDAFRALGDYQSARPQLFAAVEIGRRLHPDGDEDTALALNKLGRLQNETAEFDAAEATFRESLEMRRRLLGADHPDVAVSLNNLAMLLQDRGQLDEAASLHAEALEIRRRRLGPVHEDIANSLNNLAVLSYLRHDLRRAESLLRESLDMDQALRGDNHPNVLSTMNNLAAVLSELGELAQAESMLRDVLARRRSILGDEHPAVAQAMGNLALALKRQEKFSEAETLYRDALAMTRHLLDEQHPSVATNATNLARLLSATGRHDEAEPLYLESLAIRRAVLGETHPATIQTQLLLGDHYKEVGRADEAARFYEAARSSAVAAFGEEHPLVVRASQALADVNKGRTAPPAENDDK